MSRISVCLVAALLAGGLSAASAQTTAPATGGTSMKMKLSMTKLKEMKAKWSANKSKLKACRLEVKQKGLTGDDRWFYIEDCMNKT